MTPQALIACYESVAAASRNMLAAAQSNDWDQLVSAERECAVVVDRLRAIENPPVLDDETRRRKFDIIRTVLAHDAEIRRLTQPWVAQLETFLSGAANQRRVADAYRRP
jgi:flagellar protein FliT